MKYYFLLVGLTVSILFKPAIFYAQQSGSLFKSITIASPNAASLGKYGDFPIGYNTGTPQINIPIYTLTEGTLSLPISVSYHSSGLKVLEVASSVGMGWSLNAGGVITRTVQGSPDDRGHLSNTTHGFFSNYGYFNYLFNPSGGGAGTSCYNYPEENVAVMDEWNFFQGVKDGEPDLFVFNFGNYSGKFFFSDDRTPVLLPEKDLKIEPIVQNVAENIIGFIVTTPDGMRYYFGKNQENDGNIDAIESTNPFTSENGVSYGGVISSWYLNKIQTPDSKNQINLIYQTDQYSTYTISTFPVADDDITNKHCTLVKNYIDGVRLSQIVSSNGQVNLLPGAVRQDLGAYNPKTITDIVNTDSKSLGVIQISNGGTLCKEYEFSYSYFEDNTSSVPYILSGGATITTDSKRLKLDAIQDKSCNNSLSLPPYSFVYSSGTFAPRQLTFAQDHWGYYNGKVNNAGLIPSYTENDIYVTPGANRESSWPEMNCGSLQKILYPTGGSAEFEFEAHDIWANFIYNNDVFITQSTIGYGTGPNPQIPISLIASSNKYRFVMDFTPGIPPNGRAYIQNSSFQNIGIEVNNQALHSEVVITPGQGNHTFYLSGMDLTTNTIATVKVYEIVPTSFQDNKKIGGLRIKRQTIKDGLTNNDLVTNYFYKSGSHSTGHLYSRPMYVRVLRNNILRDIGLAPDIYNSTTNGCLFLSTGVGFKKSPNSLRPMENFQGNHIGYNFVEVSKPSNGISKYQFFGSPYWDQNLDDVSIRNVNRSCDASIPNAPDAPLPFEFKRGELSYESHKDESGNFIKAVYYDPIYTLNEKVTPIAVYGLGFLTLSSLQTAKKTYMKTITDNYSQTGAILSTTEEDFYESPYHNEITRKKIITSKGEIIETKIKYAFDFRLPSCEALTDCYQNYLTSYTNANNTFDYGIATCTSSTCNCKYPIFQSFRYYWSLARKAYLDCRKLNFTGPNNNFKTYHNNAKTNADVLLKPILELQDLHINAPIETTTWKNNVLLNASYTNYDFFGTNVYPKTIDEIKLAAPTTAFTSSANTNTVLTKDPLYQPETSINFSNGNLSEVLKKDGVPVSYVWGYNNSYPVAKVAGATAAQVNAINLVQSVLDNPASDAAMRTELDKLRTGLNGAQVATYTYSKLLGMTSETDANGKTIYYEYDLLGRLKLIRDKDGNILKTIEYKYQQ